MVYMDYTVTWLGSQHSIMLTCTWNSSLMRSRGAVAVLAAAPAAPPAINILQTENGPLKQRSSRHDPYGETQTLVGHSYLELSHMLERCAGCTAAWDIYV